MYFDPEIVYPNIFRVAKELAALNNCPIDMDEFKPAMHEILDAFDHGMLQNLDFWFKSLDDHELSIVLDGEETERDEFMGIYCPHAKLCHKLLDQIFEDAL